MSFWSRIIEALTAREPMSKVDAEAELDKRVGGRNLDHRLSIVDLMKSVGMDSSMAARKKLAAEFGITGYTGTAEQNIRLHKMLTEQMSK